jgi:hypothetical protein
MAVVKFPVSEELLRALLFRLGDTRRIVGAQLVFNGFATVVDFEVDDPDAPDDAVRMEAVYTRIDTGGYRDPCQLTAIRWQHADGAWTQQDITEGDREVPHGR